MNSHQLPNEAELLKRIGEGDEAAFREIFQYYRQRLFTVTLRIVGDVACANDIYQDVFLRVWLKRTTLQELDNFPAWLFTITRNLIYDTLKKIDNFQVNSLTILDSNPSNPTYDPGYILQNKEVQKILSVAISRLPARQQETYHLLKVQGLTRLQAAEQMAISPETVKWNLDQAMRSIRAYCLKHLDLVLSLACIFRFF